MVDDGQTSISPEQRPPGLGGFFARYFWVILKNVIGWTLILLSLAVAPWFPGPLGTVLFLLGFALVSIPGKRSFTSRMLRGIPLNTRTVRVRVTTGVVSIFVPPLIVWLFARRAQSIIHFSKLGIGRTVALYTLAIAASWIGLIWLLRLMNLAVRLLPRVRRRIRPWLKRKGINLLPPRRKMRRLSAPPEKPNESILDISSMPMPRRAWAAMRRMGRYIGRHCKKAAVFLICVI
jgi:hypothetical protein